jgi:predicted transcriptional regulator
MKEQVAEIVAAYVGKNTIEPSQLPDLIAAVSEALTGLGQEPAAPEPLIPAVPIRRSVGAESITCLDCGHQSKVLKRHLMTAHSLSPEGYRARWKLASDYPMVATNYSARRSELAKTSGLGKGNKRK